MGPRDLRLALNCFLAVGVMVTAGCSRGRSKAPPTPAKDFNVLIITVDTLRADHLGCYGHPVVKTPNMDRLAREGVRFDQCTTSAPITLPSHCTIMLGTEPYVHGIRANGALALSEPNLTLAEILREQGYRTGAHVGAFVLDSRWGLNQGFDDYQGVDLPETRELRPDEGGGIAGVLRGNAFAERKADEVREEAVEWLRAHATERFFLWVHFFDPHKAYDPPEPYRTAYHDPYSGEIAFTDEQIGRLIEALQNLGVADKTLIVLVADHGEGLGEHGEPTHLNFVYDTTLRVPLILWCPARIPAGVVVAAQVRTVDIVPTILEFLGLPPKSGAQGVSLLPLVHGQTEDLELAAYGETFVPYFTLNCAQTRCLRTGGWKYIHLPRRELYHVAEDPNELNNLVDRYPDRADDMRDQLYALLAEAPPPAPITQPAGGMAPEVIQRLIDLGYVALSPETAAEPGTDELALFEPKGEDPKDHIEEIQLLGLGIGSVHVGDYPAAERFFGQLVERGADSPIIVKWYVEALTEQDKLEEAMEQFKRAVEKKPDFAEAYNDWGLLLHRRGRDEEAVERYREAVRLRPQALTFRTNLANALTDVGQLEEAEKQFRQVAQVDPRNADAHNGLGNVFAGRDQFDEAIDAYEKAISLDPSRADFHYNLGRVLFLQDKLDDSVSSYRRALEINPDYASAYWNLGNTFRKQGKLDEAVEAYGQALRLDPNRAELAAELGLTLAMQGDFRRAIAVLGHVVKLAPDQKKAANNLAWLLATAPEASVRDGDQAVELAEALVAGNERRHPGMLDTLAAAYAETGQFDKAARTVQEAIGLASSKNRPAAVAEMKARLRLYEQRQPYRERVNRPTTTRSTAQ